MKVLLSVKDDRFGLNFSVLNVDFVSGEDDWNVFAYANQIPMPVGNIFVSHSGRDVEHDDGALALDVVAVTEAAEFLLAGRIPYIEPKITLMFKIPIYQITP